MAGHIWLDGDSDGVQGGGETGFAGIGVYLYTEAWSFAGFALSNGAGDFAFASRCPGNYRIAVWAPAGYSLSLADQGADDALDSDPARASGITALFSLAEGEMRTDVDAGLVVGCAGPDEAVYIYSMTLDGNGKPVLNIQDPNQPAEVTGYNIYRSGAPTSPWTLLGSNVVDMNGGAANIQYVDLTGDVGGPWYYKANAYSGVCSTEGP